MLILFETSAKRKFVEVLDAPCRNSIATTAVPIVETNKIGGDQMFWGPPIEGSRL